MPEAVEADSPLSLAFALNHGLSRLAGIGVPEASEADIPLRLAFDLNCRLRRLASVCQRLRRLKSP